MYSPGAYINNRSLMPCQEPPVAMSTWQASIHVPEGCVVLMSGNELIGKTAVKDGQGKAKRLLLPFPKGICGVEIQRGIYRPLKRSFQVQVYSRIQKFSKTERLARR